MILHGEKTKWRLKHPKFLKHHDICVKRVTLEDYVSSQSYIEFATFFVLSAKDLETISIKFISPPEEFRGVFYKEQQRVLKWHKKASKHARLRLSPSCTHMHQYLRDRSVEYLDLTDPLRCAC